jgi:hypothetical protein
VGRLRASEGTAASPSLGLLGLLGCLASIGTALAGSVVGAVPIHGSWWFRVGLSAWQAYAAMALSLLVLLLAWLGVGRHARAGQLGIGWCWGLLGLWGAPLLLAPPLFSRDLYSYAVQGLVAAAGHDPATTSPALLGHSTQWWSIASVWRTTPSPYGPLWTLLSRGAVGLAGHGLVADVLAMRALEVGGVCLLMVGLPVLARNRGADPSTALWLAVLSPLGLIGFLASGHNEAVALGLMVAGGALVVSGRLGLGLGIAAAGGALKLPALALPAFLGLEAIRTRPLTRARTLAVVLCVPLGVLIALSLLAGHGFSWASTRTLKIPTELHILLTPSVSVAVLLAGLLHLLGVTVATTSVIAVVQPIFEVAGIVLLGLLVAGGRRIDPVRAAGVALLVLALSSPTFWPWYLTWGLVLLAATTAQRSSVLVAAAGLAMFLVTPGGSPILQGRAYLLSGPLVVAGIVVLATGGRWRQVVDLDG